MKDLSISEATVVRAFRNLKKNDLLTRQDADKNGYWQITEKGKEVPIQNWNGCSEQFCLQLKRAVPDSFFELWYGSFLLLLIGSE